MGSGHFADDSSNNCLIKALIVPIWRFEQPKNAGGAAFGVKILTEGRLFPMGLTTHPVQPRAGHCGE
jgi:hypothetical protein